MPEDEFENLLPPEWDLEPYNWMKKIYDYLDTLPDVKVLGLGAGDGSADFSFVHARREFSVSVSGIQTEH
jgi:hypothetical protein